jgi:hypothetical protein
MSNNSSQSHDFNSYRSLAVHNHMAGLYSTADQVVLWLLTDFAILLVTPLLLPL